MVEGEVGVSMMVSHLNMITFYIWMDGQSLLPVTLIMTRCTQ